MKIFYITGVSGVGKSSVAQKLKEKGIYTIDIDSVKGLCHWIDNNTQKISEWHPGMSNDWYKKHKYICDKKKLINLINNSNKDIVVVAGLADNRSEFSNLFHKVFLLHCKEETFIRRMAERENHNFGKHILEREMMLNLYKDFERKILDEGAVPMDTDKALKDVVDEIFSKF